MVTLKPNYSHLDTSLLAMLLLIAAPKCTAWQGGSLPALAGQLRHYTGVWNGHGAAAGVPGLAASAVPARCYAEDGSTTGRAAAWPTARRHYTCHKG